MQNYGDYDKVLIFRDYISFDILGQHIHLISNETCYGQQTVAEVDDCYHYLGHADWTLSTAILVFERIYGRELTKEEVNQVLRDNNFTSQGV